MSNNFINQEHSQKKSQLTFKKIQKEWRKTNKKRKSSRYSSYTWSFIENQNYIKFLRQQQSVMIDSQKRKKTRIFVQMSKSLKRRSIQQCRSHHQKMIRTYHTIQGILQNLLKKQEERIKKKVSKSEKIKKQVIQNDLQTPQPLQNSVQIRQVRQNMNASQQIKSPNETIPDSEDFWDMIDQKFWTK